VQQVTCDTVCDMRHIVWRVTNAYLVWRVTHAYLLLRVTHAYLVWRVTHAYLLLRVTHAYHATHSYVTHCSEDVWALLALGDNPYNPKPPALQP